MSALDPSLIVPERDERAARRPWSARAATWLVDSALSLLFNGAIVVLVIRFEFPDTIIHPPADPISVEIVNEGPKEAGRSGAPNATEKNASAAGAADTAASNAPPSTPTSSPEPNPAATPAPLPPLPTPAPPPPTPAPPPPPEPQPTPEPPKPEPPKPAATPIPPEAPSPATPASTPPPVPQPTLPDLPPPLEAQNGSAQPHLVEAPPDPRKVARQTDKNVEANAVAAPPDDHPVPATAEPSPAPRVMTAPNDDDAVPPPPPKPDPKAKPPLSAAEAKRQADNTAKLAAVLPFSQTFARDDDRAALSGSGESPAEEYRGAVYGSFRKADDLVEAARAKHLRGQAVVAFSIDDAGALTSLRIAVSSGNPEVDATALDIIKRSAPFPPPPPGAAHSFSPAIGLGLDDAP